MTLVGLALSYDYNITEIHVKTVLYVTFVANVQSSSKEDCTVIIFINCKTGSMNVIHTRSPTNVMHTRNPIYTMCIGGPNKY